MKNSDWIAIVSILATALVSIYATYSQYEANAIQQERNYELERYRQANQLELLQVKAEIERFTKYCSKVELAIKEASDLKATSEEKSNNKELQKLLYLRAVEFIYLLPNDTKHDVFKIIREGKDPIETILGTLQFSYDDCLGKSGKNT
ncbi:hypothetical protein [Marinibactrum halimedae]|uniref:Uncharacterized protein n=1 Tax=Marinibactrum halimedae TaxID=1444977 RepID=A0AA37T726_9GAMM|nr:hypothetical protein [Marinibactrum halimedae]MCD9458477.1 hypothetical protein [Marinibactrum halimedae]GLS26173.1 hypothetical protein GCM10007877_18880 [Marinibactrum halimedae]